jgi:signal peptidase I
VSEVEATGESASSALEREGSALGDGDPAGGLEPGRATAQKRSTLRSILDWVVVIVVALAVAFLVDTFAIQPFYIPSMSMYPTLKPGDRILVNKLSYDFHPVHVGDIVVFRKPADDTSAGPQVKDLVKRVIGLPGQVISSCGVQVCINGKLLKEPWLPPGTITEPPIKTQTIPKGAYFVMGDNRTDSADSRVFGPIKKSLIVGRVFAIVWPPSQVRFFF